jgi:hypothetical protein
MFPSISPWKLRFSYFNKLYPRRSTTAIYGPFPRVRFNDDECPRSRDLGDKIPRLNSLNKHIIYISPDHVSVLSFEGHCSIFCFNCSPSFSFTLSSSCLTQWKSRTKANELVPGDYNSCQHYIINNGLELACHCIWKLIIMCIRKEKKSVHFERMIMMMWWCGKERWHISYKMDFCPRQ